jgi:Ca2+-binding EF-hand superfamily protein
MNKFTISALFLGITFASAGVYAGMDGKSHSGQGHKNKAHNKFLLIDTNNDGSLSKEEVLSFHEERFNTMDADANGLISKKEMKSYRKAQRSHKSKNRTVEQD